VNACCQLLDFYGADKELNKDVFSKNEACIWPARAMR
jgi:hypothetical protein